MECMPTLRLCIIPPRIFSFIPPPSHPYRQLATMLDTSTRYHSHCLTLSIVTHETSALADSHLDARSPTSVLRTSGRERYCRLLQISMLCRHRLSMTFILRSLSRKPRPLDLTSEIIMLSASFPWKESTLKHLSAHSIFSFLSICSTKLLCPS